MGNPHLGWYLSVSLNAQPVFEWDSRVDFLLGVWPDHWHLLGLQRQAHVEARLACPLEDDQIATMIELHCEASHHPISRVSQNHRAPVPLHVWSPLQSKSSSGHESLESEPHSFWVQRLWTRPHKAVAVHGDHCVGRIFSHMSRRATFCFLITIFFNFWLILPIWNQIIRKWFSPCNPPGPHSLSIRCHCPICAFLIPLTYWRRCFEIPEQ